MRKQKKNKRLSKYLVVAVMFLVRMFCIRFAGLHLAFGLKSLMPIKRKATLITPSAERADHSESAKEKKKKQIREHERERARDGTGAGYLRLVRCNCSVARYEGAKQPAEWPTTAADSDSNGVGNVNVDVDSDCGVNSDSALHCEGRRQTFDAAGVLILVRTCRTLLDSR